MSFVRAQFLSDFMWGDDVVLLAMDFSGATVVHAALADAVKRGASRLECDGITHDFFIETGTADVALGGGHVVWRLDETTAAEILEDLATAGETKTPGHQYVDIHAPAQTLVLAYDEYPPEFFDQFEEAR